tara:strand:+ start:187 stop:513 length:327 start_codon:yes stop_codon:yes gene_type:complete
VKITKIVSGNNVEVGRLDVVTPSLLVYDTEYADEGNVVLDGCFALPDMLTFYGSENQETDWEEIVETGSIEYHSQTIEIKDSADPEVEALVEGIINKVPNMLQDGPKN